MAKLTELAEATTLADADIVAITKVAESVSYKVTIATLRAIALGGPGVFAPMHDEPLIGYLDVAAGTLPATITWWQTSAKLLKYLEATITYSGALATTIVWQFYDLLGAATTSYTETRTYSGALLATLERTVTP